MFDLSDFSPWIDFKLGELLEQGLDRMKIHQMKMKHLFLDPVGEFDYDKDNIVSSFNSQHTHWCRTLLCTNFEFDTCTRYINSNTHFCPRLDITFCVCHISKKSTKLCISSAKEIKNSQIVPFAILDEVMQKYTVSLTTLNYWGLLPEAIWTFSLLRERDLTPLQRF